MSKAVLYKFFWGYPGTSNCRYLCDLSIHNYICYGCYRYYCQVIWTRDAPVLVEQYDPLVELGVPPYVQVNKAGQAT